MYFSLSYFVSPYKRVGESFSPIIHRSIFKPRFNTIQLARGSKPQRATRAFENLVWVVEKLPLFRSYRPVVESKWSTSALFLGLVSLRTRKINTVATSHRKIYFRTGLLFWGLNWRNGFNSLCASIDNLNQLKHLGFFVLNLLSLSRIFKKNRDIG